MSSMERCFILPRVSNFLDVAPWLILVLSRLSQLHVQEGALVCRRCSRQYPITQGIPNMLLTESEV
jgi:uncharacterized protein YbaR (Trm112 family)